MATRILSRTTTSCVSARFSTSVTSPEKMSANPLSIDNTSILSSSEFKDDAEKLLTSHDYFGMSTQPFSKEIAQILLAPLNEKDIEIKPDGIPYLPEIKYRRILNHGFGPGGWGLIPRSSHFFDSKTRTLSREYALFCLGRFVSLARGEQEYLETSSLATVMEAIKSNALTRCCKDLGIASELWDPVFIYEWKKKSTSTVFCTHQRTKEKKRLWRRKDREFDYPWKED
jgi:hypothetical protein